MAKMVNFSERFVFWIRQSIVETQNLDERIYVASRVFEVMEVCGIFQVFFPNFTMGNILVIYKI